MTNEHRPNIIAIVLMAIGICLVVWIGGAALVWWMSSWDMFSNADNTLTNKGLVGDSFGGVNALISSLAFAGVIVSLYLQREDLKVQREDLRLQREDINKQTDEFKKENDQLRTQRFDNTFFNMCNLFLQIVNELSIDHSRLMEVRKDPDRAMWIKPEKELINIHRDGRDLFLYSFCYENFRHGKNEYLGGMRHYLEYFGYGGYSEFHITRRYDHYFRYLYRMLKFIDQNDWLGFERQYEYAGILRAMLSPYELVWIFYNGLSENGEKLKPLLEKYSMLKNIRVRNLALSKETRDLMGQEHITRSGLADSGFSATDYEFFILCGDKRTKEC